MSFWNRISAVCTAAALALCCACAGPDSEPAADYEAMLLERVHAYNTARLENDLIAVYPILWSSYREAVSLNEYVERPRNIRIKDYEIGETLEMGDSAATVEVIISFTAMGYTFQGRREQQEWVLEDGQWYFKLDPGMSTPFGPMEMPDSDEEDVQADGQ